MAELSYPSPAHNSRNVTDAEYERIAARFSDDGVYGHPSSDTVVTAGTGLQVLVKAGYQASVRGHAWEAGTTDVPLTITSNASGSTRFDWVVLRLDRSTWTVRAAIVEGTPGAGLPSTTQDVGDTGVYELPLAYVTVPNGAASVTVTPYTLFVGSRIRSRMEATKTGFRNPGDLYFVADTGALELYDGSASQVVYSDSGVLALGAGFSTWQNVFSNVGRRKGDDVWLRIWVRRVNLNMPTSDRSGSKIGVLPGEFVSTYNNFFAARFDAGQSCLLEVRSDGEIWVTEHVSDVTEGDVLKATVKYTVIG